MPKRNLIWIVAVLLAALVVTWGTRNRWSPVNGSGWGRPSPLAHDVQLIRERWLGEIDEQVLYDAALEAVVAILDEHTSLISSEETRALEHRLEGKVNGFGLILGEIDGETVVIAPQFNSPAYDAGILPGDRIVTIDGHPASAALPAEWRIGSDGQVRAGTPLCGIYTRPDGSDDDDTVELTILRNGRELPPVILRRRKFAIETVTGIGRGKDGRWVYAVDQAGEIAYIRISEFANKGTADDLQRAMRELAHARKLVLDLRDNPGGPLDIAVNITDMFLRDGPIVTQLSRAAPPREYVAGKGGTFYPDITIVVLTNAGTASAAEIVAGALEYNGRAVLVGEPTKGKRTIQEMLPRQGGGQLNLTTSRYVFGPAAAEERDRPGLVGHQPILPQVPAAVAHEQALALRRLRMVAAGGPHTRAAHRLTGRCPPAAEPDSQAVVAELIDFDPQLTEAVKLLNSPRQMEALLEQARIRKQNAAAADEARR